MKKKLLTLGLSSTLALSSIMPAFANTIAPSADKTYIETAIGFKYPETPEDLKSKNITANLTGNGVNLEININQFLNGNNSSVNINGYNVTSEIIKENNKVTIIKFKVNDLKAASGYKLKVEGKNYTTTVVDLSTATYSKRVNISTATNMILGDVDKNGIINNDDRSLLESNLNKQNSDLDLNNDGIITASDIAIVNSNMIVNSTPRVIDTEIVPSSIKLNNEELNKNLEIKSGKIENLFTSEGSVQFTSKEQIDGNISIPLVFESPISIASVEVTIPTGIEDSQITLYDEFDNPIASTYSSDEFENNATNTMSTLSTNEDINLMQVNDATSMDTSSIDENNNPIQNNDATSMNTSSVDENNNPIQNNDTSSMDTSSVDENNNPIQNNDTSSIDTYSKSEEDKSNVVVINLGTRKPVKKITISAKPTSNGGYVEVEEVKIIGDIVTDDIVQDNIVKHLKASTGDGQVKLNWSPVNNAIGYRVYYGTDENNLNKKQSVSVTNTIISGLENLKPYYFSVSAIFNGEDNKEFEGPKSNVVSATPQPEKAPARPDFVKANAGDGSITLSWKEAENAKTYNIYAKTNKDSDYEKMASNITGTSHKLTGLTNNIEYTLYVTSQNSIGESGPSELVSATPKIEEITIPTIPTKDRIPNSNITKVEMGHPHNVDPNLYPNGFDPKWLIDENYYTHWVARNFNESNTFIFTFDEPKTMDYLIWVPRLDGQYRHSNKYYTITVWTEDNINGEGTVIARNVEITNRFENDGYYALTFPKTENIKKLSVKLGERTGGPRVNASEVAFYEYNDIADRVSELFNNNSRTEIKQSVTKEQIEILRKEVSNLEGFVIDRDVLLKELDIATSLINKDITNLGVIKDNIYSINPQKDISTYGKAINDWQPLGVVGNAGEKITIFADIPEGETVNLIPTQFFEQADRLNAPAIPLKNGRNVITIPKIGDNNYNRGGSLYVTYNGNNANKIKLQVVGGYKIPYLELRDFHKMKEEEIKQKIDKFIKELSEYKPVTSEPKQELQTTNQVEISLPNVLLSLPANKVLQGINQGTSSHEEKVDKMYQNIQAWEELMGIMYKTYGIDDHKNNSLETRHNIRYMKMFAGAFMYASGNHIGIGYDSVPGLMNGKPVDKQTPSQNQNGLFGWGIAHEIGHVMDTFGKAEVTNNIYSLIAQTYDGDKNTLPSRLEGGAYESAFKKVSVGGEGVPNDLFTHLVMYWQLHLAYDDADSTEFYNKVNKLYKTDETLKQFSDMDKFAVAASKVAKKDLTEFFTRWGVSLSPAATQEMNKLLKEERAIYYLTDESRRLRLNNNEGNKNITVTASAKVSDEDNKKVIITIEGNNQNVQGYEIIRNGKSIGFTTSNTYTDFIGSANNMSFTYEVLPVDILGNVNNNKKVSAGQVRISYDKVVESTYNIDEETGIVTFESPAIVTGIKIIPKDGNQIPTEGTFKVYADIYSEEPYKTLLENKLPEGFDALAKEGNFNSNFSSTPQTSYINYFNKPGSTEDKIWAYDVNRLKLDGIDLKKYNVEFLSYPGDNIEFMDMGIGRLANDYVYPVEVDSNGDVTQTDVIKKDTLVIIGNYRGNSALSNIYIKGKYPTQNSAYDNPTQEERLVPGYTLMLDTPDEDGKITSATAGGIFIFVPELQEDDQGDNPEKLSKLPSEIMAEIWQGTFNEDGSFSKTHKTSDTTWITMPSDESLPKIVLQTSQDGSTKMNIK